MAKKERQAKILFSYDRMWEQKLSQVYHLLIPANNQIIESAHYKNELKEELVYENSSHIYQSVIGSAKGE
jgi:hypothetical protein